jgi:hypothetical protein
MRILLVFCICFNLAQCSAQAQEASVFLGSQQATPQQSAPQQPAPQRTVPQQTAPQRAVPPVPQQAKPQSTAPQQRAPQPGAPESDPFKDDPAPSQPDNLDLDSNRGFNFDDSANTPFSNPSDFQSSVASNSNFSGASPQMIGDFGGGSLIKTVGGENSNPVVGFNGANVLTFPIPLAGGSRRIKIAENNQVMPEDRIYGTFNYFHNSNQAIGTGPFYDDPVTVVDSESLAQYTVGMEKTFCAWGTPFSIDVRMPFTGGVSQSVVNSDPSFLAQDSAADLDTGSMGNLSTALKVYLLEVKQTSISGGLGMSLPTGSDAHATTFLNVPNDDPANLGQPVATYNYLDVDNSAVHLMPFLGAYRQMGNSCWLQAFTQIDVPTGGNGVQRKSGVDRNRDGILEEVVFDQFRIKEQTLLYADVSFGKWWYRNVCECGNPMCRCQRRGLTGVASVLELHYTGSLNDADPFLSDGAANQFDVLNLTTGLTVELNEQLRINLAGVFPLGERGLDANGRREDRFFDSELALQVNYFF